MLVTGPENFEKLRLSEMTPLLDFYNLMAYDYAGSWDQNAGHQANIVPSESKPNSTPFSTIAALDYYTGTGKVPANKIILGMPIYGRGFANTDGPGAPFSGTGEGTWEQGVYDYKALPQDGAEEVNETLEDGGCGASWSYDSDKRMMISYDTAEMSKLKAQYVIDKGLGGGMWWETSADKGGKEADPGQGSLIGTFVEGVAGSDGDGLLKSENNLDYPESQYDNLKAGFPDE